jgi:hypothetical protein
VRAKFDHRNTKWIHAETGGGDMKYEWAVFRNSGRVTSWVVNHQTGHDLCVCAAHKLAPRYWLQRVRNGVMRVPCACAPDHSTRPARHHSLLTAHKSSMAHMISRWHFDWILLERKSLSKIYTNSISHTQIILRATIWSGRQVPAVNQSNLVLEVGSPPSQPKGCARGKWTTTAHLSYNKNQMELGSCRKIFALELYVL